VTLAVTPGHRQCDLVSTLARSIVTETNVSPVFFDQIQTQVDLDASSAALSRSAGHLL
jgi:glutathione synthase/RimK-type ligase-like ATP-grasp enzyme